MPTTQQPTSQQITTKRKMTTRPAMIFAKEDRAPEQFKQ